MNASFVNSDNLILRDLPAELRGQLLQHAKGLVEKYGPDPCLKGQAAAHEAGHVVFAASAGVNHLWVKIYETHGLWLGRNQWCKPDAQFTAQENPALAFAAICHNLAGKAGEIVQGYRYESSSVDEEFLAMGISSNLDDHFNWRPGQSFSLAQLLVLCTLENYQYQHKQLSLELEANRRISRKKIASYTKGIRTHRLFTLSPQEEQGREKILKLINEAIGNV